MLIYHHLNESTLQYPYVADGWESWTSEDLEEMRLKPSGYRGHPYSVDFNRFVLN